MQGVSTSLPRPSWPRNRHRCVRLGGRKAGQVRRCLTDPPAPHLARSVAGQGHTQQLHPQEQWRAVYTAAAPRHPSRKRYPHTAEDVAPADVAITLTAGKHDPPTITSPSRNNYARKFPSLAALSFPRTCRQEGLRATTHQTPVTTRRAGKTLLSNQMLKETHNHTQSKSPGACQWGLQSTQSKALN